MKWRYTLTFFILLTCFFAIDMKLFQWQIIQAEELASLGRQQSAANVEIQPKRGDIIASDGFPIVTNKLTYLVFANPKEILQKDELSHTLADVLKIDVASVSAELALDKFWVPIKSNVSSSVKDQIDAMKLPGVGFEEAPTRFYPEASMAAQLVGFVGKDEQGQSKGYFGLEGYYDRQLHGRVGEATVIHDAFGRPVLAKLTENSGQQDGRNLVLHTDRVIQYLVEQRLKAGIDAYGAKSGTAIVMDPKTGGILAMASFPSFDQATFWQYDGSLYVNPAVTDTYEPGSTFKPLVMSAALDLGLITPTTTCPICDKPVQVGDYAIHTWDDKYFPNTNMIDILQHSDNTGMVYVGQKLGLDRMISSLEKFGVGQTTGIDLQGEVAPEMRPRNSWYPIDLATASYGQGITVTPMELIDAFASIANGGKRMEPHVVAEINTPDGQKIPIAPKVLDQAISEQTAKVMTEMLVNTVNKGEASFARLKGYRIAGKTGTASIAKDGHYDTQHTIASFEGFAPADNPKFVALVILNEPEVSIYGSETAAPIFFDIAQGILTYYGIAPTEGE